MMKTSKIYIAAALALTLAACSEQDDFTQADIANAAIENANAGDVPVAFGTYVGTGGTTRSGEIGEITENDILKGTSTTSAGSGHNVNGFGVFAFNTGSLTWAERDGSSGKEKVIPNFMYNERVYWDTDSWKYSPIKYWPNGIDNQNADNSPSNTATAASVQYLTFYAYAPYTYVTESSGKEKASAASEGYDVEASQKGSVGNGITNITSNSTAGDPIITYSLPASNPTGKNTVDLLWGIRGQLTYEETDAANNTIGALSNSVYNTDLTKQKVDERVRFLFKHALAKIADIKVVYDLDGNGTPTQGYGTDDPNTLVTVSSVTIKPKATTQFYKTGKFNIATGAWDMTEAASYSTELNIAGTNALDDAVKEPAAHPVYSSGWKYSGGSEAFDGVRTSPKSLYTGYDPIMFIPGSSHAPQLTIAVTYIVRTYDGKLDTGASDSEGTWSKVTQTITNDVTLPTLAVNTKYSLVMHLGLTSVKFSAQISGWDEGATTEVWLPSNVVNTTAWTLDEGATQTVHVAANCETYTITLNNITEGVATIDISGDGNYKSDGSSASAPSANSSTVTIKLNANNTASPVSSVITLQGKDSGSANKGDATVITIIQAAKES